jgi:LPS O-antigen subunit length determinant protein (WzzB/FepE family)
VVEVQEQVVQLQELELALALVAQLLVPQVVEVQELIAQPAVPQVQELVAQVRELDNLSLNKSQKLESPLLRAFLWRYLVSIIY